MSFDRNVLSPNPDTHVPVTAHVPKEDNSLAVGRPDIPPPSLWQRSVKVVRKLDGREAIVNSIDLSMMMFRAYYPDEGPTGEDGKPRGRFAERTEWEHCKDWNVSVTFAPKELERQAAKRLLDEAIMKLDPTELALASVLCDDVDPTKSLAKLEALRRIGAIKAAPEVAQAALAEARAEPPKKGK